MAKVTGLTATKMLEIENKSEEAKNVALGTLSQSEQARDAAMSAANAASVGATNSQAAAQLASSSATNASNSADRAEAAADGVDMDAINQRLSDMDTNIQGKANLVGGKVPFAELSTSQATDPNTIPSRAAGGRLPGIGAPTSANDAVNKAHLDAVLQAIDADLTDFQNSMASKQDLMLTTRLDAMLDGQTVATAAFECALLAAPVDMELTAVVLTFDDPIHISGTTNSVNVRIVHRPNSDVSGINIVQLSSEKQTIGGPTEASRRKAWNMKNGSWNTASNRVVPAGDIISLVLGSPKGSFRFTFPVIITMMWRPI